MATFARLKGAVTKTPMFFESSKAVQASFSLQNLQVSCPPGFWWSLANPREPDEVVRYVLLQRVTCGTGWNLGLKRAGRELHKSREELDDLAAGDEGNASAGRLCATRDPPGVEVI